MIATILISVLLVALALSLRGLVVSSQREAWSSLNELRPAFSVKALERLLNPAEDQYLQERLARHEFYRIRRKRASLAFRYLRLLQQDVRPLITRELSGSRRDQEMQNVTMMAASVRMKIVIAQAYLIVQWIFPAANLTRWVGVAKLCERLDKTTVLQTSRTRRVV